jgi:23S rRNA (cytidine1920-2'-O)/16S rRNA (cytidine1409-2'-O)-methyltransferase
MNKQRLDQALVAQGLTATRSQAESYIKLGNVTVNGKTIQKAGTLIGEEDALSLNVAIQYVSRAALKLASVADIFQLDFSDKTVLDVGSSTGGFTDFALQHGATKVIAVDVGTDQLHPSLHLNPRIELYEKTDIRQFSTAHKIDIVVADVSFISLREILPSIQRLSVKSTKIVVMLKPQFEAGDSLKHKGVIKNDTMRRDIIKKFEQWVTADFVIVSKADSQVSGSKGNRERFYLLKAV